MAGARTRRARRSPRYNRHGPWPARALPPRTVKEAGGAPDTTPLILLATGLGGAAVVHVAQHHRPLAQPGMASLAQEAGATLAACPLLPALVTLGVLLGLLGWALLHRLRALQRQRREVSERLAHLRRPPAAPSGAEDRPAVVAVSLPRSPWRYVLHLCSIGAVEVTTSVALTIVVPMHTAMHMAGGMLMDVPAMHPLALALLHGAVIVLLGTLVWVVERRVVLLRSVVEALRATVASYASDAAAAPLPLPPTRQAAPRCALLGHALFSRPPPHHAGGALLPATRACL